MQDFRYPCWIERSDWLRADSQIKHSWIHKQQTCGGRRTWNHTWKGMQTHTHPFNCWAVNLTVKHIQYASSMDKHSPTTPKTFLMSGTKIASSSTRVRMKIQESEWERQENSLSLLHNINNALRAWEKEREDMFSEFLIEIVHSQVFDLLGSEWAAQWAEQPIESRDALTSPKHPEVGRCRILATALIPHVLRIKNVRSDQSIYLRH